MFKKEVSTIAVDFDGTLCYSRWPNLGEPNMGLIHYLLEWKQRGNKLILWTCREGEILDQAVFWCKNYGLEFDAINDNLPENIELFGSNSRKVSCDYYIDDKCYNPHSNFWNGENRQDCNKMLLV